jgi:hypothetical protein
MPKEIYFSVDMEADGPSPADNSMLSIGAVVYDDKGNRLKETFSMNINPLEGHVQDAGTMSWWKGFPDAWAACHENPQDAEVVMPIFLDWVESLKKKYNASAMFVAYPAAFDYTYVMWYLMKFCEGCTPFGKPNSKPFSDIVDMQSLAMGILRQPYSKCAKNRWPKKWFSDFPHTHIAVEDALAQGEIFAYMLRLCING